MSSDREERRLQKARSRKRKKDIKAFRWWYWNTSIKETVKGEEYITDSSSGHNAKTEHKNLSNSTIRAKEKMELKNNPEDISTSKGNEYKKKYDYKWSID